MDQLGNPRGPTSHGMREGQAKPVAPQKNAYARLVQQHHSGRFRAYLHHVAQTLQQGEAGFRDFGFEVGSPPIRAMRDTLGRNGPYAPTYSANRTPQHERQLNQASDKFSKDSDPVRKAPTSANRQHERRDTNTNPGAAAALEEDSTPRLGLIIVSDAQGGRVVFNCTRDGTSLQTFSGAVERDEKALVQHKTKKRLIGPSTPQKNEDLSATGQPADNGATADAVIPGYIQSGRIQDGEKTSPRTRNFSESATSPLNINRTRQLSESQLESMNIADCRINLWQMGTPRAGFNGSTSTPNDKRKNRNRSNRGKKKPIFEPYLPLSEVQDGIQRGELLQGAIRINPKKFQEAFFPSPDGTRDIFIDGIVSRNRALNGDIVVVKVLPREQWKVVKADGCDKDLAGVPDSSAPVEAPAKSNVDSPDVIIEAQFDDSGMEDAQGPLADSMGRMSLKAADQVASLSPGTARISTNGSQNAADPRHLPDKCIQKTAKVVYIMEKKHSRAATGFIKPLADKNSDIYRKYAMFSAVDHRVPRIYVPLADCPENFMARPDDYTNTLFICHIVDWKEDNNFALGKLTKSLGQAGEIEPETEGILMEYGVDFSDFSPVVLECLPQDLPWTIPPNEYKTRKDLRKECIFTIDPATARDLDDALSCKQLPDGNFEVGVHIADVSYFLKEGTALDEVAGERATSVYLVQKVIPMLPRLLCEELCSLNPMTDRLTFSVIWKLSPEGKILDEWFGRSIICSCVKLSYDHAQSMIENPNKLFSPEELPPVDPHHPVDEIQQAVLNLHGLARNMRKQRFDGGALRLDQMKLAFTLDKESGMPQGCYVYQYRDSNKLVEEFMLLANMAVAHQIHRAYPTQALLRRHPPPQSKLLDDLIEFCDQMGLNIDFSNAGTLHKTLNETLGNDQYAAARKEVLTNMCSRPMQMAVYFCTGALKDESQYRHYALNVPLYTHFTSPIRRFADVIVHRLLAASIGCGDPLNLPMAGVQKQAEHCNDRKTASKRVQEQSADLFFSVFVKESGPLESEAMVMGILSEAFDVLVLRYGVQKRIYCNALPLHGVRFDKVGKKPELTLIWKPETPEQATVHQVITVFTLVEVLLKSDGPLKYSAVLKHPGDTQEDV